MPEQPGDANYKKNVPSKKRHVSEEVGRGMLASTATKDHDNLAVTGADVAIMTPIRSQALVPVLLNQSQGTRTKTTTTTNQEMLVDNLDDVSPEDPDLQGAQTIINLDERRSHSRTKGKQDLLPETQTTKHMPAPSSISLLGQPLSLRLRPTALGLNRHRILSVGWLKSNTAAGSRT